jgi:hypothetical protein
MALPIGEFESGIFLVSPLGGQERQIVRRRSSAFDFGNQLSWSPTGEATKVVNVKHDPRLVLISWASNGKGWFTATKERSGMVLLFVDLQGNAHRLWELKGGMLVSGLPSPDGRHLAIVGTVRNNNVWLMENF